MYESNVNEHTENALLSPSALSNLFISVRVTVQNTGCEAEIHPALDCKWIADIKSKAYVYYCI